MIAQKIVLSAIMNARGIDNIIITRNMFSSVREFRKRYQMYLENNTETIIEIKPSPTQIAREEMEKTEIE